MQKEEFQNTRTEMIPAPRAGVGSRSLPAAVRSLGPAGGSRGPAFRPADEIKQHVQLFVRNWLFMAALAVLGAVGGLVYLLYQPVIYRASSVIEIQGFNETFMNYDRVDPQAGLGNYSASSINIQTQLRLLGSPTLSERVRTQIVKGGSNTISPRPDRFAPLRAALHSSTVDQHKFFGQALQRAATTISARPIIGTRLVEVSSDSDSPEIAAKFVNRLVSEFIAEDLQSRTGGVRKASEWVSAQVEELRTRVEAAESRLQEFVKAQGIVFVAPQNTLAESKLRQLQDQLAATQAERLAKQARWEMVRQDKPGSLAEIGQDMTINSFEHELTALRRQEAELLLSLTPGHTKVQKIAAQIEQIDTQLKARRDSIVRRIESEYQSVAVRERALAGAYSAQSRSIAGQTDNVSDHENLKRELDAARKAHDAMLEQQNQTGIAAAMPTNHIRVVDPATAPNLAVKPKPAQLIGWGAALGLVFSIGFVYAREHVKGSVRSPGELSTVLNVPELGIIPSANESYAATARTPAALKANGLSLNGSRVELASLNQRGSLLAESFRVALASILYENARGWKPQALVVSSAVQGEGKTTVSSNLAIAIALTGRRVILLDADLRAPRLHGIFELSNERGLVDWVAGGQPLDELVQATAIENLSVMCAGQVAQRPAAINLYSRRLPELIAALRQRFELVLIDTAPMLQFPDARVFGRMADGVVLVTRAGVTQADSAVKAGELLTTDGTPLVGTILNDWRPTASERRGLLRGYNYYGNAS